VLLDKIGDLVSICEDDEMLTISSGSLDAFSLSRRSLSWTNDTEGDAIHWGEKSHE
jgi:hypothetical protein